MAHFANFGDLPMCRYLYHVRGASTMAPEEEHWTQRSDNPNMHDMFYIPMWAAVFNDHFETTNGFSTMVPGQI